MLLIVQCIKFCAAKHNTDVTDPCLYQRYKLFVNQRLQVFSLNDKLSPNKDKVLKRPKACGMMIN